MSSSANRGIRRYAAVSISVVVFGAIAGCEDILGIGDLPAVSADGAADSATKDGTTVDAISDIDAGVDSGGDSGVAMDTGAPDAAGVGLEAYVKAQNTTTAGLTGGFGQSVALSGDGNTMVVGATGESSNGSSDSDTSANGAGAAYVFSRSGTTWTASGYLKAANARAGAHFGQVVAISQDGTLVAVASPDESSAAKGVGGNAADTSAPGAGAVYVFQKSGATWSQTQYIKASNTRAGGNFGGAMAFSADGYTLAVGSYTEPSNAKGVNGDQTNQSAANAGAVYVFGTTTKGTGFTQQAYLKASNTSAGAQFAAVSLSSDGNELAVGAFGDPSAATGVNGDQADTSAAYAGAVYVFNRTAGNTWSQSTYLKASNTRSSGYFGFAVSLSAGGDRLAVGSHGESCANAGVGANQTDPTAPQAGAVYTFSRSGGAWAQDAYVKPANPHTTAHFGWSVTMAPDGNSLLVGSEQELSGARGVNAPDASDTSSPNTGAAYFFTRTPGVVWTQRDYLKADNARKDAQFGFAVTMDSHGLTLGIGSLGESSRATGINAAAPGPGDTTAPGAGAAYVYR